MSKLIDFKDIFPDETPLEFSEYIKGVSSNILLTYFSTLLVREDSLFVKPKEQYKDLFNGWLGRLYMEKKKEIGLQLLKLNKDLGQDGFIYSKYTLLKFIDKFLKYRNDEQDSNILDPEDELNVFKAYLLVNGEFTDKSDKLLENLKTKGNCKFELNWKFVLANSIGQFNVSNYDLTEIFVSQCYKSILMIEFLSTFSSYSELCLSWYKSIGVENGKYLLKRDLGFILRSLNAAILNSKRLDLKFENEEINNFIRYTIGGVQEEVDDFLNIRLRPLYKKENDVLTPIFLPFLVDKIYKSIYFDLYKYLQSNSNLYHKNPKSLKSEIGDCFFEKRLSYEVIENCFKGINKILLRGESFNDQGSPDYYYRDKMSLFIFEIKDVLLKKEIKQSFDYDDIIGELKKKFKDKNEKGNARGIPQIINVIKGLYFGKFRLDKYFNLKRVKIYPILLVQDKTLSSSSINYLLNLWFIELLKDLDQEMKDGNVKLKIQRIKPITIINIDSLIYFEDLFSSGSLKLDKCIADYHRYLGNIKNNKGEFLSFDIWLMREFNNIEPSKRILNYISNFLFDKDLFDVSNI